MSTSIALVVRGISYQATLDGRVAVIKDGAGTLVGQIWTGADAEVLDACLPEGLPVALALARQLAAAEEAQAEAVGMMALRREQGRTLGEAHWESMARRCAIRAELARAELAKLASTELVKAAAAELAS